MKPLVYLAGAIAGLTYDDAADWRKIVNHRLAERGIETLNPMRAKHALGEPVIDDLAPVGSIIVGEAGDGAGEIDEWFHQ